MSNKFKNNVAFVVEIVWLIVAVVALAAGIHQTYRQGIGKSWPFFMIIFVALFMFTYRRNTRKARLRRESEGDGGIGN